MALSGIRKISVIDTPPRNRHPIKTEVIPFDEDVIAEAILEEVKRGGQVFFVHNRAASIHSMQAFLERLLPDVRFGVAHGQMKERELEKVILAFLEKEFLRKLRRTFKTNLTEPLSCLITSGFEIRTTLSNSLKKSPQAFPV